jgi:arsenate reductase-like glutaredoxin family protein
LINEAITYEKNCAKWKAAKEWCEDRMIEFKIITEDDLNL